MMHFVIFRQSMCDVLAKLSDKKTKYQTTAFEFFLVVAKPVVGWWRLCEGRGASFPAFTEAVGPRSRLFLHDPHPSHAAQKHPAAPLPGNGRGAFFDGLAQWSVWVSR
jgi:hypothetical protein